MIGDTRGAENKHGKDKWPHVTGKRKEVVEGVKIQGREESGSERR